jgi:hypothetical protein
MVGVIVIGGHPLLFVGIDRPSRDLEAASGLFWEEYLPSEWFVASALHLNNHQNRAASCANLPLY